MLDAAAERDARGGPTLSPEAAREALLAHGVRPSVVDDIVRPKAASPLAAAFESADLVDRMVDTYKPDPDNNLGAKLEAQMKERSTAKRPRLNIIVHPRDGRVERISLDAAETRAHIRGTLAERRTIEARKVFECRLERAIAAATRIAERHSNRLVTSSLTPEESAALEDFGGVVHGPDGPRIDARFVAEAKSVLAAARLDGTGARALRETSPRDNFGDYRRFFDDEKLTIGPNAQVTYLNDTWDEYAKCQYAFAHDAVAKQAVKIITGFVLGRGVQVRAKHKDVEALLAEFVSRIQLQRRLRSWTTAASRDGELFLHVYPIGRGRADVRALAPNSIWEVVTLAEDVTVPLAYVQRYLTRPQPYAPTPVAPVYIQREYPADEIVHLKLNVTESEVRGRSDMLPALVWLKSLRDYWFAAVTKEQIKASTVYTATFDGDAADLAALKSAMPKTIPPPGSSIVANKKLEIQLLATSQSADSGTNSTYEGLVNLVAMCFGFNKLYLGADGQRSRAGAVVQSEPSEKSMEERQDEISSTTDEVLRRVISIADANGSLKNVPPDQLYDFDVEFPSIVKADSATVMTGLQIGRANSYYSQESAARRWAVEMDIDDYDYDEEQAKIEAEREKGITALGLPPKTDPIDVPATSTTIPDPTSSDGKSDIRNQDRQSIPPRIVTPDGITIRRLPA